MFSEELERVSDDLIAIVGGDAVRMLSLIELSQDVIWQAWQCSDQPTLTRSGVVRVVRDLLDGRISEETAGHWGLFILSGVIGRADPQGLFRDIDIHFESEATDAIAESVHRLHSLGGALDGGLSPEQLIGMIRQLS